MPLWVQVTLYGTMPLFHLHTFLFLSALLGWWIVLGRTGRAAAVRGDRPGPLGGAAGHGLRLAGDGALPARAERRRAWCISSRDGCRRTRSFSGTGS